MAHNEVWERFRYGRRVAFGFGVDDDERVCLADHHLQRVLLDAGYRRVE